MQDPITIDAPRSTPVLDLGPLTRHELSVLTGMMRRANLDARTVGIGLDDPTPYVGLVEDLLILRLEVRAIFLDRLAREG